MGYSTILACSVCDGMNGIRMLSMVSPIGVDGNESDMCWCNCQWWNGCGGGQRKTSVVRTRLVGGQDFAF